MCRKNEREAKNKQKINKHTRGHVQKNQASCGKSRAYVQPCAFDLTSREISDEISLEVKSNAGLFWRLYLKLDLTRNPASAPEISLEVKSNADGCIFGLFPPPPKSGETDFQTCGGLTLAAAGDLSITHDRCGSSSHVHQNGLLSHPQDLGAPLRFAAQRKINSYGQQYADNLNISFLPALVSTSTRMHGDFLRLVFLQAHWETEAHFTASVSLRRLLSWMS